MAGGVSPPANTVLLAALYSVGAHGIMTLNDFKSIEGDRRLGIGSLPARLGPQRAGVVACVAMAVPQFVVVALLARWGETLQALAVGGLLAGQIALMFRLLERPRERAPWYNATGVSLYVIGMLISAFALRGLGR
jgi:chlorophyll synthase